MAGASILLVALISKYDTCLSRVAIFNQIVRVLNAWNESHFQSKNPDSRYSLIRHALSVSTNASRLQGSGDWRCGVQSLAG
jgi:hypothetical protein